VSRDLRVIDSSNHQSLTSALATALDGAGPAVFPVSSLTYSEFPTSVDSEVALVIETSGSSSRPKRVWHTVESLRAAAHQVNDELDGPGLWWNALPCHYIAGVMVVVRALRSTSEVIAKNPRHSIGDSLLAFDQKANESSPSVPRFTSLVPKQLSDLISAAAVITPRLSPQTIFSDSGWRATSS
jgi:Acyl-CoA synthetases (AMP-forming)/AMP-acid ligases II